MKFIAFFFICLHLKMRRFLQILFTRPVSWLANRFSSNPDAARVSKTLTDLLAHTLKHPGKKGLHIEMNSETDSFIIFSDQHKGAKDGSDDFMNAESNYLTALDYYYKNGFRFISLGDSEELWENTVWSVIPKNKITTEAEKKFLEADRFMKVFGNHDLYWSKDPLAGLQLIRMYGRTVPIYEAVLLKTTINHHKARIFLTHGHQGDGQSDGNPFSAWFVGTIWAPLQSYLNLNPNTPAASKALKTIHNRFMYSWSKNQKNLLLITGHTHQPVFASLTHLERLYRDLFQEKQEQNQQRVQQLEKEIEFREQEYEFVRDEYNHLKPVYFNTGCCCFRDGDITGIEITEGKIRLIKWSTSGNSSIRIVLEEALLSDLFR